MKPTPSPSLALPVRIKEGRIVDADGTSIALICQQANEVVAAVNTFPKAKAALEASVEQLERADAKLDILADGGTKMAIRQSVDRMKAVLRDMEQSK